MEQLKFFFLIKRPLLISQLLLPKSSIFHWLSSYLTCIELRYIGQFNMVFLFYSSELRRFLANNTVFRLARMQYF